MSENTASLEKNLSKQDIEDRLNKTQLFINTYQAAAFNKLLYGLNFRFDLFENSKKKISSSNKRKANMAEIPEDPIELNPIAPQTHSESGAGSQESFWSNQNDDKQPNDLDNSLARRTSRREKKPTTKVDLGYEEPKTIKGVKLSGNAKEIFRKWEEVLASLKDEFSKIPELTSKAAKFDQEVIKLKDGNYKNTMILGNSIRKYLNSMLTTLHASPSASTKIALVIKKFEESFSALDNKIIFEESKMEVLSARNGKVNSKMIKKGSKSGGSFGLDPNRPMSDEEKKELSRSIRNLNAQQLKGIISIVRDMFPEKDGMLEFDIDKLPPYKWRELEEYVREVRKTGMKPVKPPSISTPNGLSRQGSKSFGNDLNGIQNRSKSSHHPKDINKRGKVFEFIEVISENYH